MKSLVSESPMVGGRSTSPEALPPYDSPMVYLSSPTCGAPGPLLEPGTRMERFTIIRHLGSGRGAHVYLAHDDLRSHEVAIKVADLHPNSASAVETRMRREIDLRRRVGSHPHVLTLFDTYRIRLGGLDLVVLSMEYADGGDLRQWLTRTQNDPTARVEKGRKHVLEAAKGILVLHRAGIVHLDVKPENMLCVQGIWKIGDLDHARLIEELRAREPQETLGRDELHLLGTPGYLSPEMHEPGATCIDIRADIYSLGVVLRETLRGGDYRVPRREHSDRSTGKTVLARVLDKCLKAEPNDRFQVVDHVIELLEYEHRAGPQGYPTVRWPRDDRRWRHTRRCLADGRVRDARRLCAALLDSCSYHPGARAVMLEMDRQEHQTLETARRLVANPRTAVVHAIGDLRKIAELLPTHDETLKVIAAAEEEVEDCRGALIDALTCLSSGNLTGFAGGLDRASAWDPQDSTMLDACVRARDLEHYCIGSRRKIAETVAHRQYRHALRLIRRHRRFLADLANNSRRILATLEDRTAVASKRSS